MRRSKLRLPPTSSHTASMILLTWLSMWRVALASGASIWLFAHPGGWEGLLATPLLFCPRLLQLTPIPWSWDTCVSLFSTNKNDLLWAYASTVEGPGTSSTSVRKKPGPISIQGVPAGRFSPCFLHLIPHPSSCYSLLRRMYLFLLCAGGLCLKDWCQESK